MKNYYANKILPLTIKQLKKAEAEYRSRKHQVYDSASYEFVSIVARVTKVTAMDLKMTDQTDILQIQMFPGALKKGVDPSAGIYYRFSFSPRRNVLNGNSGDVFGLQIIGITRINPNEITIHLISCMQQKIGRQNFKQGSKVNGQSSRQQLMSVQQSISPNNSSQRIANNSGSLPNKRSSIQWDITKYCRQLGKQFDVDCIAVNFRQKYAIKQIQKVLQILSQKGLIMDLGIVYEWAGQTEQQQNIQE